MSDDVAIWRERLRQAQEAYTQASAGAAKIQIDYASQQHTADGNLTLQQALRAERQARDEYMRVLRILNRVLEGKTPE